MKELKTVEFDIEYKYSIDEFIDIVEGFREIGATHLKLSYQDYGNPLIDLFEETEQEQQEIPITYSYVKRIIGWSRFCDITGRNHYAINEFGGYPDNEIFYVTEEQARKLNI